MGCPDDAARRVDELVNAGHGLTADQLRQAVLPPGQQAGARRKVGSSGRMPPLPCHEIGEAAIAFSAHLPFPIKGLIASCSPVTHSTPAPRNRSAWLGQVSRMSVSTSALTPFRYVMQR